MPLPPCAKCGGRLVIERGLGQEVRFVCINCGHSGGARPDLTPTPKLRCPECGEEQTKGAQGLASHRTHVHGGLAMPARKHPKAMAIAPREFGIR